jgi:hypothetical protein
VVEGGCSQLSCDGVVGATQAPFPAPQCSADFAPQHLLTSLLKTEMSAIAAR